MGHQSQHAQNGKYVEPHFFTKAHTHTHVCLHTCLSNLRKAAQETEVHDERCRKVRACVCVCYVYASMQQHVGAPALVVIRRRRRSRERQS